MTDKPTMDRVWEALEAAQAHMRRILPAHFKAQDLPPVMHKIREALALRDTIMGSVSCQELKVSGVTPRNDPANPASCEITDIIRKNLLHQLNLDHSDIRELPEGATIECNITTFRKVADYIRTTEPVTVSLEKCARVLAGIFWDYDTHDDIRCVHPSRERYIDNTWEKGFSLEAKAVLDAAGVPYVD